MCARVFYFFFLFFGSYFIFHVSCLMYVHVPQISCYLTSSWNTKKPTNKQKQKIHLNNKFFLFLLSFLEFHSFFDFFVLFCFWWNMCVTHHHQWCKKSITWPHPLWFCFGNHLNLCYSLIKCSMKSKAYIKCCCCCWPLFVCLFLHIIFHILRANQIKFS